MKVFLILIFPTIGWCGPFLICDPSENTTSYIIRCNQEYLEEVAAEPDGSLFYDIAGQHCDEWSVNAANSEAVIDVVMPTTPNAMETLMAWTFSGWSKKDSMSFILPTILGLSLNPNRYRRCCENSA